MSKPETINDFKSAMNFLLDSMLDTVNYLAQGSHGVKPSFQVQTEKFSSFFDKIVDTPELLTNFKEKVVLSLYQREMLSILRPLTSEDGKVQDDFIKVRSEDGDGQFQLRTNPKGLYFQISKVFLPLSEVYTEAVKISVEKKRENLPFPAKILLGFYSTIRYSIDRTDREAIKTLEANIDLLKGSLDVCDEVKPQRSEGPMGMIKNILGNVDFDQIGEMMKKITGDENSSKEFQEVFGKITDTLKDGGNPMEAMGEMIKRASVEAAEREGEQKVTEPTETSDTPVPAPRDTLTEIPPADSVTEQVAEISLDDLPQSGVMSAGAQE